MITWNSFSRFLLSLLMGLLFSVLEGYLSKKVICRRRVVAPTARRCLAAGCFYERVVKRWSLLLLLIFFKGGLSVAFHISRSFLFVLYSSCASIKSVRASPLRFNSNFEFFYLQSHQSCKKTQITCYLLSTSEFRNKRISIEYLNTLVALSFTKQLTSTSCETNWSSLVSLVSRLIQIL